MLPPPAYREELKRTISAWGDEAQRKLARVRFGIIGIGSVGSVVAETLARTGIQHIVLLDYDRVERHNLDRLLHASSRDAEMGRLKVDVIGEALESSATAAQPLIERLPLAITEDDGFRQALDCDVVFSCVDRPWPRHVLNYVANAHLIPVIDGGILIRTHPNGRLRHASWRSHAVFPGVRCLQCMEQYDPDLVNVERRGDLDDPHYIASLPRDHAARRNENVFAFSTHLAASLVFHALHLVLKPVGISYTGEQVFHFVDGSVGHERGETCREGCYFHSVTGRGDAEGLPVTGQDLRAADVRRSAPPPTAPPLRPRGLWDRIRDWFRP